MFVKKKREGKKVSSEILSIEIKSRKYSIYIMV